MGRKSRRSFFLCLNSGKKKKCVEQRNDAIENRNDQSPEESRETALNSSKYMWNEAFIYGLGGSRRQDSKKFRCLCLIGIFYLKPYDVAISSSGKNRLDRLKPSRETIQRF
jgi:hypothetical protein